MKRHGATFQSSHPKQGCNFITASIVTRIAAFFTLNGYFAVTKRAAGQTKNGAKKSAGRKALRIF